MQKPWHALEAGEVLKLLKSTKEGLSSKEAAKRLVTNGKNELPQKEPKHWASIFFNQFKSPLIYILVGAGLIELFFKDWLNATVIFIAVAVNALIGFIQEYKAENALVALHKFISYEAKVYRDGKLTTIQSIDLVCGDVVVVEAGDRVPADGRLFEVKELQAIESSLTGESLPVLKQIEARPEETSLGDRTSMLYLGSVISNGRGHFVVTDTGLKTQMGEVAGLILETQEDETPLQQKISKLGKQLSYLVFAIGLVIMIEGQISGKSPLEMFETAVAVGVAAIPEGLAISITVILALGMQRILKQKALTKSLLAAETLGSTSVICSDKTGTLTEGIMKVTTFQLADDLLRQLGDEAVLARRNEMLTIAVLANDAFVKIDPQTKKKIYVGDTTESALLEGAGSVGLDFESIKGSLPRLDSIPFNSDEKFMATLNQAPGNNLIAVKGATDLLLNRCVSYYSSEGEKKFDAEMQARILEQLKTMSEQGLRVLGVAYKKASLEKKDLVSDDISELVYLGMVGLVDPLRSESKTMLQVAKGAGIRTVIITGDHLLTVSAIARELGYKITSTNVAIGEDLDKMSEVELRERVKEIDIYARVSPRHKIRIVDALQSNGEVVAMLGDGVNDAPALKSADIGVVLGSGTDVAKQTADIILMDDNFKTVVLAIRQGRMMLDNIRKVVVYLLASSFTEVILISGSLILNLPLPLTALQILYINIVADSLPTFGMAFETGEDGVMKRKPLARTSSLITNPMKIIILISGLATDFLLLGLFIYKLNQGISLIHLQTIMFMSVGISAMLYVYACKSLELSIFKSKIFNNKLLLALTGVGIIVQILPVIYLPLGNILGMTSLNLTDWSLIIAASAVKLLAIETVKFFIRMNKHAQLPA